ncbi:MAG: hypothetical protein LKG79_01905 [Furfurilactobacillus sp.]|jgi:ABC-type phosphate transport system permease subunit|uniref:RDD domain-containing protein n=1 Tax=Furfurilactobacillus milii TaxID=2888272 RepID=A0ABT6D770_9LACO|nr:MULTISPECIES: hypothetical protein [Furfurilactobacillus]QLE66580.1 hypothetical protein LROSL2_1230 [Furfurilactobacillus rossiae]MCF6160032.1 hypothetical protein [Furfurilactobacillus milii]MCF6162419.1 hypothetical protein [Furfurilactobacillus milii]MCF6419939.1 hypothetical protein [Furfurilactobacillus milii]MCH4010714.1 hypothetical protein [Furfurilactobacillus sp.]
MINTKKNMLRFALVDTVMGCMFIEFSWHNHLFKPSGGIIAILALFIFIFARNFLLPDGRPVYRMKSLLKIRKNSQSVSNLPNNEREWQLILEADYLSTRVLIILMIFPLIAAILIPEYANISNVSQLISLNIDTVGFIVVCLIALAFLIKEWTMLALYSWFSQNK